MLEQLHIAAQYLSAFGYSYKEHKDDDSQSNLGYSTKKKRLVSRKFKDFRLGLNLKTFSLEWLQKNKVADELPLDGLKHEKVLAWINEHLKTAKIEKPFQFQFNYDLPFEKIEDLFTYKLDRVAQMEKVANNFSQAKKQLKKFLKNNNLDSPIRVWPHHFDMGVYAELDKSKNLFIGGGLAIPDTLEDVQYYYVSGWLDGEAVKTADFPSLSVGRWRKDWDGATLPSTDVSEKEIESFLNECYQNFS